MISAILSVGSRTQKVLQHTVLQCLWFGEMLFQLMLSGCECISCNAC